MDLNSLMPQQSKVLVGTTKITLHEPNILQQAEFFKLVAGLELQGIVKPVVEMIRQNMQRADDVPGSRLMAALKDFGEDLVGALTPILGDRLPEAIVGASAVLLDRREIYKLLTAGGDPVLSVKDGEKVDFELTPGGGYLRCDSVRGWIHENCTLQQAIFILNEAWKLSNIVESVGKLIAGLIPAGEIESKEGSVESQPSA